MVIELKCGEAWWLPWWLGLCLNIKDDLRNCLVCMFVFVAYKSGGSSVKLVRLGKIGGVWKKEMEEEIL